MATKNKKPTTTFEDLFPAIAEWIDTRGWIEFGQDDQSRSMARVLDEGGMIWEGKKKYPSINEVFADVEQALKKELDYEEDDDEEIPVPATSSKKASPASSTNTFIPVDSSMIQAVRYNAITKEMDVLYNTGKTWRYNKVGKKEYEGLINASSKGRYILSNIIDCYEETPIRLGKR
jgi:hypothetical protein